MIFFYGVDPSGAVEASCGGEEVKVSDTAGPYYDKCESSSYFSDKWKC